MASWQSRPSVCATRGSARENSVAPIEKEIIIRELIRNKLVSPVEVVKASLDRIETINPLINAYCTVVPELALESARAAEAALMRGEQIGLLHGIPVSIKDVSVTKGIRTTFGSRLYENHIPSSDALIVERLKKAGAIIIVKTNCPEFAAGASTFNQVFGMTRNPWDTSCNSGGSSGGAAAAVAAGLCPLAEGNDFGGAGGGGGKNTTAKDLRIAWSDNLNITPVDDKVLKTARPAIDVFLALGGKVVEDTP